MQHSTRKSEPMPRRRFLEAGAVAATFSIMSPELAFGSEANSRVTVGFVGLGGRGAWIADHVSKQEGFKITAVADYFPDVVGSVGERLGVGQEMRFSGLNGYRHVIDSKVDAVFLETPPYFFPQHARAAAEAGCHVYVAKPVAVDVPGCMSILESARIAAKKGKTFLVDFQTRTDPYHIEAVRRVREGMIGRLCLISAYYHDECFADPPRERTIENLLKGLAWVNDTALGGAYIVNCDIHAIDVALWIANELPESAVGFSARNRPGAHSDSHDCYAVSFNFSSGLVMTDHSEHIRNSTDFRSGCMAYGQTGHLEANYAGKTFVRGLEDGYGGGENRNLYAEGMERNVAAFHNSIVEGRADIATVEPSVNSTLATILGREAALQQRRITWAELLKDTKRIEPDLSGLRL
ncbi:MAG TPA: Gfo/Idh/MocA family oxidoreductase [Verrucomicrobiota bacterium]|nr:Gfo/Idh/MocA family oxidoreductase [Verrucomicrobiota bacterium]